jgi:predicted negative regulator of RcsB-dependent stress response
MADDYLSDREQEEALRNWWRENWSWVLGGIVLGALILIGWQWYRTHLAQRAHEASATYQEYRAAGADADKAEAALATLIKEHPSSLHTMYARLEQAKKHVEAGQYDEAATQLRAVVDASKDDELALVAKLRLARVLIQQNKYDDAVKLLDVKKAGAFAASVREVRGDALFAKGDMEGARAEYAAALTENADAQTDRTLIEMKLQQSGGAAPATQAQNQP